MYTLMLFDKQAGRYRNAEHMKKTIKTSAAKRKVPSEALECQSLVDYLKSRGIRFSHIPNSTNSRAQGIKNKRMGTSAGVPDYLILLPNVTLWLEMKRVKGGRVSSEQRDWVMALNAQPGQRAAVANGFEHAKKIIQETLDESRFAV